MEERNIIERMCCSIHILISPALFQTSTKPRLNSAYVAAISFQSDRQNGSNLTSLTREYFHSLVKQFCSRKMNNLVLNYYPERNVNRSSLPYSYSPPYVFDMTISTQFYFTSNVIPLLPSLITLCFKNNLIFYPMKSLFLLKFR